MKLGSIRFCAKPVSSVYIEYAEILVFRISASPVMVLSRRSSGRDDLFTYASILDLARSKNKPAEAHGRCWCRPRHPIPSLLLSDWVSVELGTINDGMAEVVVCNLDRCSGMKLVPPDGGGARNG